MAALYLVPPILTSKSEPPTLFDGTTRLYISVICPYAQRVWSARNIKIFILLIPCFVLEALVLHMRYHYPLIETIENKMQGLSQIQIVPIDLQDKPAWYKEKVYPPNKVPSLEHNGKVIGESMDLLEYLENNFEGPKLFPTDPAKKEAANELLKYTDTFTQKLLVALIKPEPEAPQEAVPALDYLENALGKFADGPFLLGQLNVVDIVYGPFVERLQVVLPVLKNYDITADRPKLLKWIQELHKIEAYAKTVAAPELYVETYKRIQAMQLHK